MSEQTRPLTDLELALCRWMLNNSGPDAMALLPQLEVASVTSWRCPCGCASINFRIQGRPDAELCGQPVADFEFRQGDEFCGIAIFQHHGTLTGLDVFGYSGDAPKVLPKADEL